MVTKYLNNCTSKNKKKNGKNCFFIRNRFGIKVQSVNKKVVTIEGLTLDGNLHPLQEAFAEHDAMQCGYCTPGMILTAYSFLRKNPHPSASEVIDGMNDNLCRCGAHDRIVKAIHSAAEKM